MHDCGREIGQFIKIARFLRDHSPTVNVRQDEMPYSRPDRAPSPANAQGHTAPGLVRVTHLGARWFLSVAGALIACAATSPAHAEVERPPQFVVMAFDNCTELERWQELSDFAAEMNRDGERVHFTFFVSGVNLVADASRLLYEGPRQRRGYSSINFGGSAEDVRKRVDFINALNRDGHEIASHAVGHFNGASWSAAEWMREFRSFGDILDKVGPNNALLDAVTLGFTHQRVVGFRAPYLATSPGLYAALKTSGFRYDASRISPATAWPEQIDGLWRFNLVPLKISGSGRGTLSMDYNFFVAQSRGVKDPHRQALYRQQMLATYLDYFRSSYAGNRAPLHIGHHFFGYQGGVYNEALKAFARTVCVLAEVRCTTYEKLADFMDRLPPETLAGYRNGDFPHAQRPSFDAVPSQ
jgi:peptidoglycan/xylan/chitin deacetylase (PgdA/CDA1 family)